MTADGVAPPQAGDNAPRIDDLPTRLRTRIVVLACDALGAMPAAQIPGTLRKSATFAPARRRRLIGPQLSQALEDDAEFRDRLAVHARALLPALAADLDRDAPVVADDEAAALSFLIRQPGWDAIVASAAAALPPATRVDAGAIERLNAALATVRADLRQAKDKHRAQLDAVKAENSQLRRNLGQSRIELRDAQERADEAAAAVAEAERSIEVSDRAHAAEVRRLRQRVTELESQHTSARRATRDDRDAEITRLRLLLDTMAEALAGFRRELALPLSDVLPADTVSAIEPETASQAASAGRLLNSDDPAMLRSLIDLPKVHLIVDGYNVSKTAWPTAPLDQQRDRLIAGVSGLVAGKGIEVTIVFDGADLRHRPVLGASRRLVRVLFSPPGVIADDVIFQLVEAEPSGRPVVVVSSDRELTRRTAKKGARGVDALALARSISS